MLTILTHTALRRNDSVQWNRIIDHPSLFIGPSGTWGPICEARIRMSVTPTLCSDLTDVTLADTSLILSDDIQGKFADASGAILWLQFLNFCVDFIDVEYSG